MHKFPVVFVIDFSLLLHHLLSYRVSLFETGGHNVQSAWESYKTVSVSFLWLR